MNAGHEATTAGQGVQDLLFDGDFAVNAQPTANGFELWTTNPTGAACMKAGAEW